MENAHAMTQAIIQAAIEPVKAKVQAMSEVVGPTEISNALATTPM